MDETYTHTSSDGGEALAENIGDSGIIPFADEVEAKPAVAETAHTPIKL